MEWVAISPSLPTKIEIDLFLHGDGLHKSRKAYYIFRISVADPISFPPSVFQISISYPRT